MFILPVGTLIKNDGRSFWICRKKRNFSFRGCISNIVTIKHCAFMLKGSLTVRFSTFTQCILRWNLYQLKGEALFSSRPLRLTMLGAFHHQRMAAGSRDGLTRRPGLKMSRTSVSRQTPGTLKIDTTEKHRRRRVSSLGLLESCQLC